MFVCCAAFLSFHCSLWLLILVVVLYCIVVLFSVLCTSVCFVSQWHPSGRSLSHPRCLLTSSRLVLAWPRLALICHVLFCSCRFRLPLRVAFSFRFLRVVFCKSLVLSRCSALRVFPAETRLTVYRRLRVLTKKNCKIDMAQNLYIQIQRGDFSPARHILKRRLVVSNVKFYYFEACKTTGTESQMRQKMTIFVKM